MRIAIALNTVTSAIAEDLSGEIPFRDLISAKLQGSIVKWLAVPDNGVGNWWHLALGKYQTLSTWSCPFYIHVSAFPIGEPTS